MQDLASVFADTNVSVRTVLDAVGDVWFSCTDVAKAVGYENVPQAVQNLMPDRKELSEIEPPLSIGRVGFSGVFGNQWKQAKGLGYADAPQAIKTNCKSAKTWAELQGGTGDDLSLEGTFHPQTKLAPEAHSYDRRNSLLCIQLCRLERTRELRRLH